MLEIETDVILKTIVGRTIGDGESIALKDIVSANIPKGIKVYIQAEIERGLQSEMSASQWFVRVGGDSSVATHVMRTFLGTLALEYVFPRKEFLTMLDNAVHFLENYLCRPHWTLENFLFENAERIACDVLLRKLQYFTEYSYLITLLERLVRQKGWTEIAIGDFRSLLVIIDDQIVKQHTARELALLSKPIFEFLLLGEVTPQVAVSLKPLLVFYEDKNMRILKLYLERICQIRGKTEISMNELAGIIEDLYTDGFGRADKHEAAPPAQVQTEKPELQENPVTTPELPFDKSTQVEPPPVPLQKPMTSRPPIPITIISPAERRIEAHRKEPDPELFPPSTDAENEDETEPDAVKDNEEPGIPGAVVPPENGRKNIPLSLTFAGLKRNPEQPPPRDLNVIITWEQREKFVRKLFKRDGEAYDDTITELNSTDTWRDASIYLNRLFEAYKLDPFSDDVIEFTDAVQQRFSNGPSTPT